MPTGLSVEVCQFQDAADHPNLLPRRREIRESVGVIFEMAAECRVFARSVGGGSWLEHKLVKDRWTRCLFLVLTAVRVTT